MRSSPSKRLFEAIGSQLVLHGLGGEAPRVGEDYEIDKILGAGGFGLICRATQLALRRPVALKIYPLGGERDPGVREALREARSLARLEHVNIVAVHAAGESTLRGAEPLPCAYVEMQLIEGQTLRQWLLAEPRPAAQVVALLVEAGRALAYAHEQGVLHRDFKPDNVMVDDRGHVTVIDFGLALATDHRDGARAEDQWDGDADALGTRATSTGLVRGTPGYMAPEASQGRPLAASDQFALAVVLREALTGRHPFVPDREPVAAPPDDGPAMMERLRSVLDQAMAVTPADRFDGIGPLCDAIEQALVPERRPWRAAAVVAGVSVVLGTAWMVRAGLDDPEPSTSRSAEVVTKPSESPAERPSDETSGRTNSNTTAPDDAGPAPGSTGSESGATPSDTSTGPDPSTDPASEEAVSCDDLEAFAGAWQLGTRVLWTEYAYQLDSRIEWELSLTVEPRCTLSVLARKYPPLVESEPRGEPWEATTRSTAVRETDGTRSGWRLPLRLAFEGDSRTYSSEEHYDLDLWLDRTDADAPRLRGSFEKINAQGYTLRNGLLLGDRHLAPAGPAITVDALPCALQCRTECAGAGSRLSCRRRACTPWEDDPHDRCGPPSFDFVPPLRARASRKTVRAGKSPLAQGLLRGDRAQQLATCAEHARRLAGRWAVWRASKGPPVEATRLQVELSVDECALTGTARGPDGATVPSTALTGEVTYAGTWVLTPTEPTDWMPASLVLTGVGPDAPALGVDTGDEMHRLRALRLDP